MPSLLPLGGTIRLNPSAGGAATVVPLAEGGFAAVYRVANGPDVFTLYDDNFQPLTGEVTVTSDDFLAPQAAAMNDGQFVVAWLANDQSIQATIYNSDGSVATGPVTLVVPTDASVGLSEPRIVGNAFGGFTAIWQDNATVDGVTGAVFVQSYDGDGNPVGDPITVLPPPVDAADTSTIETFQIAVLGDGTTVVAAQVAINGVDSIMYSVNGGPLISLAGGDPNYIYTNPEITPLAAGGYVITYDFVDPNLVGSASPDANWTTGGSVFTSAGNRHDFAIGTTVTTTENGTFAVDPSVITPLGDGGFVVTFEPLTSPLGDGYLVDAQQFDAFGNAVGPVVLVAPQGFLPSVATSANGVVLDTYQFGSGIFLQAYNSAPTPLGPEPVGTSFGLNSVVSANSPGVAPLTDGGFVVVFQDQNGNSWAQIFNSNRQAVGSTFEVAAGGVQPVVASQTNGTFLVAWSTGTQIDGAVYDNQGDLLDGPFSMSGDPSALPLLDPALNAMPSGGYMLAYETDLQNGSGSHLVTIQQFDVNGGAGGPAVSQTYAPTNPLAPPKIAALEADLFGSVTVIGIGDAIVAAIVSDPPSGGGAARIQGASLMGVSSHSNSAPTTNTIQVSGVNDGATRVGAQVATINDGDVVVVWNEAAANANTWQIVGQVMTPAGVFVGAQFRITTALPSNSPAAQIALSALADGGFLVTFDAGNTSLASQRFDASGHEIGAPVLMTGAGQGDALTTLLSDGTLLLLSNNTTDSGTLLSGATFSLPSIQMNWTGATSTELGTATNWDVDVPPDSGHAMQFGLSNGGTLTGTATANSATFTGQGPWVLSAASVNLTEGMTEQSALQIQGGSLTAGGVAAIGVAAGASVTASANAQVSFESTAIGTGMGQAGTLTLTGTGTSWTDTGSNGAGGFQAGGGAGPKPGDGTVNVTLGALLTGTDTDVLGVTAGSEGSLSITNAGTVRDGGLVVGQAGTGVVTLNGGVFSSTGSVDIGQDAGGQGTFTVTGTTAAMTVSGAMIVGDAGVGSVTIQNQGTVSSLAGLVIANVSNVAVSSVSVSGAGSLLNVTGLLDVGVGGSGELQVSGGAQVTAGSLDAGNVSTALGQINLSGTGTELTITNAATVGDDGTGLLSVLAGATFAAASLTVGSLGHSSGALVVSGAGSVLRIGGALNIGTALGTGDLTVGPGASVIAAVVNVQGEVVLEGGLLDPVVQLINKNQPAVGFGTIEAGDIVDEGVIQAGGSKPSQDLLVVEGTVLGGGTLTVNGTLLASNPTGVMQINSSGTLELTGPVLNATTTTFTDDLSPVDTYTVNNSVVDVTFVDGTGVLLLDDIAGFAGTITAYQPGDSFVITGGTLSGLNVVNSNTLVFSDSGTGAGPGGIDQLIFGSAVNPLAFGIVNGDTVVAEAATPDASCFAAGTGIATTRGLVPVEAIHPGDRVCTVLGGDTAEVIWVGHRKVDCARHPDPVKVWPVRVSAHAFGRGMPARDLMLSPDHAVYVDGVLIPIRMLVNGRSVRQVLADSVTYYHVELPQHDVLLADGMPAESYLDIGDRSRFSNGGGVVALHPDFSARTWEMLGCAPLVQTGPVLDAVRKRLSADVARRGRRPRETAGVETRLPR